jgi:Major Facilitator Superfamily.
MSVFYPAGTVMDRFGRIWVALPSALLMGLSLMLTPLSTGVTTFLLFSLILGFGNGISSGIVMTLGADAAPAQGRTEFLGIWRLIADIGNSVGPVILAGITAIASLAVGVSAIGTLGLGAAAVFWKWVPRKPTASH